MTALYNFTRLHMKEGLHFDREHLQWLNQRNEVIEISSRGKKISEESLLYRISRRVGAILGRCMDFFAQLCLLHKIFPPNKDSTYSLREQHVMNLYGVIYSNLDRKVHYEVGDLIYNRDRGMGILRGPRNPNPPPEMRDYLAAYQVIHNAAQAIRSTKNFKIMSDIPDYKLARIRPLIDFLRNAPPLPEIVLPG